MKTLLKNGHVVDYKSKIDKQLDILIEDKYIKSIGNIKEQVDEIIDCTGLYIVPGLIDMHCHLRDPGFEYKEDIVSGVSSAVKGGFTSIACMPNTEPKIDSVDTVNYIIEKAKQQNKANVFPIACITKGSQSTDLVDMGRLKKAGAIAFSDDGMPVRNAKIMKQAMQNAKKNNAAVISHCEEPSLGYGIINEGEISEVLNVLGMPEEAEEIMVARELVLAEANKVPIHIAHISTKISANLIRDAKARNVSVTCEVCPHHFTLSEQDVLKFGTNAKINPPLRTQEDVEAIINAIKDGTVDAIATDHAPHSKEEKEKSLEDSPNGIIGFETALKLAITYLIDKGNIDYIKLVELMSYNPSQILKIDRGVLSEGEIADITIFDPNRTSIYKQEDIVSKARNTPYIGMKLKGEVMYTIVNGRVVYKA